MPKYIEYNLNGQSPLVSVIINCYNGDAYLKQAIDSVIKQTYLNWEIILWDNVSTVDIKSIARSFNDPRIKYHLATHHTALGEARNQAISVAKGAYLAFLDSDDLWGNKKLESQVNLFQKDDGLVLVYTDVESFNASGNRRRHGGYKRYYRGEIFGKLIEDYFLIMSAVMIRAETYFTHQISFNPKFQMVEESDVFTRISLYGRADYVDEVLSYWRVHKNSVTWSNYGLIASESEEMIYGLIEDFPGIQEKYPKQFLSKKSWILRQKILSLWLNNNGGEARSLIKNNYDLVSSKVKLFYWFTWLRPKLFAKMLFHFFGSTVTPD